MKTHIEKLKKEEHQKLLNNIYQVSGVPDNPKMNSTNSP